MSTTKQPSARKRHSFVQFYMNDWLAGTARMSRIARSIYFDICVYNWDKVEAVPLAELQLMVSDIENQEQANFLINNMTATGKLVENDDGSIYSPRAMAEGQRAMAAWEAKSRGGKKRAKGSTKAEDTKAKPAELEDTSDTVGTATDDSSIERDRDRERDRESSSDDISNDENQNSDLDLKKTIPDRWNVMAMANGLRQVIEMNEKRDTKLTAIIDKFGIDQVSSALDSIPACSFLLGYGDDGWKISFDWFTNPENFVKVLEGAYQDEEPVEVEQTPSEPAKPPKLVAVHPDEGKEGAQVRAIIIEKLGKDKFPWIFSDVQFHAQDGRIAVVPEKPTLNISDFMVNHGPVIADACEQLGLLEPWGKPHRELKEYQQRTIDARDKAA